MEKRILRLEDDFWRIRTDTGELADAERNALKAYLDEKGFKTAIIDDNLAIAGELTWQEPREKQPHRAPWKSIWSPAPSIATSSANTVVTLGSMPK